MVLRPASIGKPSDCRRKMGREGKDFVSGHGSNESLDIASSAGAVVGPGSGVLF